MRLWRARCKIKDKCHGFSLLFYCLCSIVAQSASQQLLQCKNGNKMEIGGDFNLGQLESEEKDGKSN